MGRIGLIEQTGGVAIGWLSIGVPAVLGITDVILRAGMIDDLHAYR